MMVLLAFDEVDVVEGFAVGLPLLLEPYCELWWCEGFRPCRYPSYG